MSKITNNGFTRLWHMLLYSCTHMATVDVKGLKTSLRPPPLSNQSDSRHSHCYRPTAAWALTRAWWCRTVLNTNSSAVQATDDYNSMSVGKWPMMVASLTDTWHHVTNVLPVPGARSPDTVSGVAQQSTSRHHLGTFLWSLGRRTL